MAVVFSLGAAAAWGAGDFGGGLAARRANVFGVVIVAHIVGLALLAGLAVIGGETIPPPVDLVWGGAAGLAGGIGLAALYRALAVGQMGIVAPITAVLAAAVPVIFGALLEGLPGVTQLSGFGLALVSVGLVSRPRATTGRPAGLELAVIGGLGFGGFLILTDRVGDDAVLWPLAAARVASITLMLTLVMSSRQAWQPTGRMLPLIALSGASDAGGNALFLLATQTGRLDVSAVLSSLYPAVTVLLARSILHEQIDRVQAAGVMMALAAILLIAL